MTRLDFDRESTYAGDSIQVSVRIKPPSGAPFRAYAFLDTGASLSVFDITVAKPAGIDRLQDGRRIRMKTADGTEATGYVFELSMEFEGYDLLVPVAFCPDWPPHTKNLLGMEGFLEQIDFGLIHADRRAFFSRH